MLSEVEQALRERYGIEIVHEVGSGGMGVVYKARLPSGTIAALKLVRITDSDSEQRGVELLKSSTLRGHRGIVQLLPEELQPQPPVVCGYFVTLWEFCEGGDLLGRLEYYQKQKHLPGIPLDELVGYMRDVAEPIDFLNGQGIAHRDVKPANILLDREQGHAKLADPSLLKFIGSETGSHTGMGTFGYMPPEALDGQTKSTIDLFGLVATFVKLATGHEPFGDGSQAAIRLAKGDADVSGLPPEIAMLVNAVLSLPADRRPQSATAWINAVQAARSKEQPSLPDELFGAEEMLRRSIARNNEQADRELRATVHSLKAEIATHIKSEDWTQVDRVAEKLLELVPNDCEASAARELAFQRAFPDDVRRELFKNIPARSLGVGPKSRNTVLWIIYISLLLLTVAAGLILMSIFLDLIFSGGKKWFFADQYENVLIFTAMLGIPHALLLSFLYRMITYRIRFTQKLLEYCSPHSACVLRRFADYFPRLNSYVMLLKTNYLVYPFAVVWIAVALLNFVAIIKLVVMYN